MKTRNCIVFWIGQSPKQKNNKKLGILPFIYDLLETKRVLQVTRAMETTKQSIISKASEMYRRFGIRSVTMDDLARELSISKKTIYRYIKDKDLIVRLSAELKVSEIKKRIDTIANNTADAVKKHFDFYMQLTDFFLDRGLSFERDLKKYYPELHNTMYSEVTAYLTDKLENNIKDGIQQGFFRADIDEQFISQLELIHIENLARRESTSFITLYKTETFQKLVSYQIRAIATDSGLKKLQNYTNDITVKTKY